MDRKVKHQSPRNLTGKVRYPGLAAVFMSALAIASSCYSLLGNKTTLSPIIIAQEAASPPVEIVSFLSQWVTGLSGVSPTTATAAMASAPASRGGTTSGTLSMTDHNYRLLDFPVFNIHDKSEENAYVNCVMSAYDQVDIQEKISRYRKHFEKYHKTVTGLAAANRCANLMRENGDSSSALRTYRSIDRGVQAGDAARVCKVNQSILLLDLHQTAQAESLLNEVAASIDKRDDPFQEGLYLITTILKGAILRGENARDEEYSLYQGAIQRTADMMHAHPAEKWPALYAAASYAMLFDWRRRCDPGNIDQMSNDHQRFMANIPLTRWTWQYHGYIQKLTIQQN